jgi:deoxyribose-phosphate aldolase
MISKEQLAKLIDHSLLNPSVTDDDVKKACQEALQYGFAAVVVNPSHVPIVARELKGSPVKACSVVSFPFGLSTTAAKVHEARIALEEGAEEIDMVMNFSALKSGHSDLVLNDIKEVVQEARRVYGKVIVKVILENCYLTENEKRRACQLTMRAGADYVKTSTGFGKSGATIEDVRLMRKVVGPKFGVKAAGGIRTVEQALQMIDGGANRIGASASASIVESLKPS